MMYQHGYECADQLINLKTMTQSLTAHTSYLVKTRSYSQHKTNKEKPNQVSNQRGCTFKYLMLSVVENLCFNQSVTGYIDNVSSKQET